MGEKKSAKKSIDTDDLDVGLLLNALKSFKKGNFNIRMPVNQSGIAGAIAETFNDVAELNEAMAKEFDRVRGVVGGEGKIKQRAVLHGASGSWTACIDVVNDLIDDLLQPVNEMSKIISAVAEGDLNRSMALEVDGNPLKGEFLKTAKIINTMVTQLGNFASEVTRVAREVGTDGKLGGQAKVKGVSGIWKDLTDNVNTMANNLTEQVRNIAEVTTAVANGDLTKKITVDAKGEILELRNTINTMVDQLGSFASEVTRVSREVGTEGKLGGQARVEGVSGTWKDLTFNVNVMASNLTNQVRNIAQVTTAVAKGDLNQMITVDASGEILELKSTINTMVDQLSTFAAEVTRVASEVGGEGKLGGQAKVPGVAGTWKRLTDNVNMLANNLTKQVRNIAQVTTAVAEGDLSQKITVDASGEILELKSTINTMVDQLSTFAAEVTRVASEVGGEGKLGGQAAVPGVAGTWKDLTDNVNMLANNLTEQVRNIAQVTTAVAKGDLTQKITVEASGEIQELKNTINTMVDQLSTFAAEVTRVASEVGGDGKLGGQAAVPGVAGTWKDLTDNVNMLASNLTNQVRNIAQVTTAVAKGDLNQMITVDASGEILELKDTINTMVDQLGTFAAEVTRVAREVGTEGKLGGQGKVEGVSGTWRELTDNVNTMASNLTDQVRDIAQVTTAVAKGDLERKITIDASGEIQELKNTINTMVAQLSTFAAEVTRVASEVGGEGKLGGQAAVPGVAGTWKDLTDNVNMLANNLTEQVRNIAQVTTAVAKGDLNQKITVDASGEILELKNTINIMVDQLGTFAAEVTRVASEVGGAGKLGGQAAVPGVAGTWKDLTDNVNMLANNLTEQVRNIAQVTTAVAEGDLNQKITVEAKGEILALKNTINTMVDQLRAFASEVTRVAREVGTEGKLGGQGKVEGVSGTWRELTDNVNTMASNLTDQVRDIAQVTTAVAKGDLEKKITIDASGEILALKNTINIMVDQLNSFASEVTRVAREVGYEGILGGQANVKGLAGTWRELTDNVNMMAGNLTEQVRGIAGVVTAVANGDLKKKLTLQARGEISELASTINEMVETLSVFADQVTNVAREVGVDGKLGGQAKVPGAQGLWRDLTDNVNQLAANLTTQVRAIGKVVTAVAKGDMSSTIAVDALGEMETLKNDINTMIGALAETTRTNAEQDFLKTNVARFTRMMQGQRDLKTVAEMVLSELAPVISAQHGVFYIMAKENEEDKLTLLSSYAYTERKNLSTHFKLREGLVGQCAYEKKRILLTQVPADYVRISSGLGESSPLNIIVLPVLFENEVLAVMELASFEQYNDSRMEFLEQLADSMGIVINTISATTRTEDLLQESQSMSEELQNQQEELQQTNEELEGKATELEEQNTEVERKNREVEEAKLSLEEKAEQLALTSKYKSEFLSNMSHELRTPLNSLLILSKMLTDNKDNNLTEKQIEFARTIHGSGNDLLGLINDILDLSKIESGTMSIDISDVKFTKLKRFSEKNFQQVAEDRKLDFDIKLDKKLPAAIRTDEKRLNQIIKNLLSNAFKFTESGSVTFDMSVAEKGWSADHQGLNNTSTVIAFAVKDTGIGIAPEKQKIIFEAFQQADGTTSREYGGTGLGLSISREIARLLGGEIRLASTPDEGSLFTLFLPSSIEPRETELQVHDISEKKEFRSEMPVNSTSAKSTAAPVTKATKSRVELPLHCPMEMDDDRDTIEPGDHVLLIVEDDRDFAKILADLAKEKGFKSLIALRGHTALALAREYHPDAISLDIGLPDMDGLTILDQLKHRSDTRHIPVNIISAGEKKATALKMGAISYVTKPVTREVLAIEFEKITRFIDRPVKELLVVEDDTVLRKSIVELIGNGDVHTQAVGTGKEAIAILKEKEIDCMVIDLGLPDISGITLIEKIAKELGLNNLPIIIYTGKALTQKEETALKQFADSIIIKDARSMDRLMDETTLFLHRVEKNLPDQKKEILKQLSRKDPALAGKTVLIVDDDVRNIFAVSSMLEQYEMKTLFSENGKDGIETLKNNSDIDIVLMDIMMPGMDGYETMRQIRKIKKFKSMPIISLTAKAMKGDREECIKAGASDYIAKPVDEEQLLSLIRVWLYK